MTFREIDPATADPSEIYSLLVGCVVPRPIAFVSSLSSGGVANLAPFSFFNAGGAHPPSLVFSPVTSGAGRDKDTLNNVRATREYVVHISPWALREKMNQASADYPPDVSEFEKAGFTKAPSVKVKPWRALECPVAMECRLFKIVEHGAGPLRANYVIGEVVYFHIAESLFVNGRIDSGALDAIGRLGGPLYTHVTKESVFNLPRPVLPAGS
ncbi:MAG TPA: flavin reductase family protein [Candidatus Limnocylindrales bacterium]|nr:flavin reductase family protein [Candidatus Limnocylindrales bacterium]